MQHAGPFEPQLHKRSLEAWNHPPHAAAANAADETRRVGSLDLHLDDRLAQPVSNVAGSLQERDPRVTPAVLDQEPPGHASRPCN